MDNQVKFVFTDGHATMQLTGFYNELRHMDQIDWDIVKEIYWNDNKDDGDRKRRRQAEFLVYKFLPLESFTCFCVYNEDMKIKLENLLLKYQIEIKVSVKKEWYF